MSWLISEPVSIAPIEVMAQARAGLADRQTHLAAQMSAIVGVDSSMSGMARVTKIQNAVGEIGKLEAILGEVASAVRKSGAGNDTELFDSMAQAAANGDRAALLRYQAKFDAAQAAKIDPQIDFSPFHMGSR